MPKTGKLLFSITADYLKATTEGLWLVQIVYFADSKNNFDSSEFVCRRIIYR